MIFSGAASSIIKCVKNRIEKQITEVGTTGQQTFEIYIWGVFILFY